MHRTPWYGSTPVVLLVQCQELVGQLALLTISTPGSTGLSTQCRRLGHEYENAHARVGTVIGRVGGDDGIKSQSDAFLNPQEKMATIVKEANAGDFGSVKRIIAHYEATSEEDSIVEEWRAKKRPGRLAMRKNSIATQRSCSPEQELKLIP